MKLICFYMNRQVGTLVVLWWLTSVVAHGQQCVRQFGSTLTLNACEHCVQLEANYVTSYHRLASSPEKFSAVVMISNSSGSLLVRGTQHALLRVMCDRSYSLALTGSFSYYSCFF